MRYYSGGWTFPDSESLNEEIGQTWIKGVVQRTGWVRLIMIVMDMVITHLEVFSFQ